MISINAQIIETICKNDKDNIDDLINLSKSSLHSLLNIQIPFITPRIGSVCLDLNQIKYLNYLYSNVETIVKAKRNELDTFKKIFDSIISTQQMRSTPYKVFRNEIIKIMGYKNLRDNFYSSYFEKVGIKSCVYCNSQLALTVTKTNGIKSAKFQVDHFFSKSDYPCFSISFYNLYPVCGPCNNSKGTKEIIFNLYSDKYIDFKSSKFKFELDQKSLLKYRVNGMDSELIIKFKDAGSGFNKTFDIEGIYTTQKDIAEELVIKSMIYNKSYTESLRNGLEKLYKNRAPILDRLMIGNYLDEKDIHKRPFAKFTQDIARQLKLI